MGNRFNLARGGLTGLLLFGGATEGMAQDALEEITVTAQRREETLQQVPLAVTAFSQRDLERFNITEALDLAFTVPNFIAQNNTGLGSSNVYSIRALNNTETIATFDPPVGTYIDDIFIQRQNANNFKFFDFERVEVLRGPQGTLFGRNTTGGAVRFLLKDPDPEYGAYAEFGYGRFNRIETRATVDVPVTDKLSTQFSAFYVGDDGFVQNVITDQTVNDEESFGFRGTLLFKPNDFVTWDFAGTYMDQSHLSVLNTDPDGEAVEPGTINNGVLGFIDANNIDITEPRVAGFNITEGGIDSDQLTENLFSGQGLQDEVDSLILSSNLRFDFDDIQFEFITGIVNTDQNFLVPFFDGFLGVFGGATPPGGFFTIANEGEHDQFTQEVKATGSLFDGRVDYIAGFYYFFEQNDTEFAQQIGGALNYRRFLENDTESFAGYAQADIDVMPDLTFTAGLRYTDERKEIEVRHSIPDSLAPFATPATATFDTGDLEDIGIPTEQNVDLLTPRMALKYDVTSDINVFASVTRGFKSGGWNARGVPAEELQPFAPEIVWSYEGGIRSQWFNGRLTFNTTAFYSDVNDFQLPSAFEGADGGAVFITQNFADLRVLGVETEISALPLDSLQVFLNIGYQDPEYRNLDPSVRDSQQACLDGTGPCGVGIVAPNGSIAEPVRAPELTISFGGTYTQSLGAFGELSLTGLGRYVSDHEVGTANLAASFVEDRFAVNANLTWLGPEERYKLIVECNNCNNDVFRNSILAGTQYFNDPRTWAIRGAYRF